MSWYNTLTSTGDLDWDDSSELCGQEGVVCDGSYQRVTKLYFLFFI